jgi:hypothetical protein
MLDTRVQLTKITALDCGMAFGYLAGQGEAKGVIWTPWQ